MHLPLRILSWVVYLKIQIVCSGISYYTYTFTSEFPVENLEFFF